MTSMVDSSIRSRRKKSIIRRTKGVVRSVVRSIGYDVVPYLASSEFPEDFSEDHKSIIRAVMRFTMTSPERLYALIEAVRYVVQKNVEGAILECGVWRGGSMMAAALTLQGVKAVDRELYLFDTFEGMPRPQEVDKAYDGSDAGAIFQALKTGEDSSAYCHASLSEVQDAFATVQYPKDKIHFVQGKVEQTVPRHAPSKIAILRLDTDWYESTKHELEHLFPLLSVGGVILIDDYGHWQGCKKAVDEYFAGSQRRIFLTRVDYTGRLGIKLA